MYYIVVIAHIYMYMCQAIYISMLHTIVAMHMYILVYMQSRVYTPVPCTGYVCIYQALSYLGTTSLTLTSSKTTTPREGT